MIKGIVGETNFMCLCVREVSKKLWKIETIVSLSLFFFKKMEKCSGQNLTHVKITTRVQRKEHEPTPENPFRSLRHLLSEDTLHPQLWGHTASRRRSGSNPRVLPRGSNSLHPTADRDGSCKSRRRFKQLIKQLEITIDDHPACQSQLSRLNPGDYKNQRIQTEQLKIYIYPHLLHRLCEIQTHLQRSRFPNSHSTYHTTLAYTNTITITNKFNQQSTIEINQA